MALCIPISVLGEVSAICFEGKRHSVEELHDLIDFLDRYNSPRCESRYIIIFPVSELSKLKFFKYLNK
jgi:hypothetical protein